jgi:excisionase family DNA binding protein
MTDLTTKQAAQVLGVVPGTVKMYIRRRLLLATKRGRDWFIPEAEVERYAATRRKPGRPAPPPDDPAARAAAARITVPDTDEGA